jgi:serine/threonine protein phosphatase PrpC
VRTAFYRARGLPTEEAVRQAISEANTAIYTSAEQDPSRAGMGCTVVALVVNGSELTIGHVGDSRAYLIRAGRIRQITADHSWVAMQVAEGIQTPEQAAHHPNRSLLMRALGRQPSVEIDVNAYKLQSGDVLLVCSDGLTGVVNDADIGEIASHNPPQAAAEQLIRLANQRGAPDNVTVVTAAIRGSIVAADDAGNAQTVTIPLVDPPTPRPSKGFLDAPTLRGTEVLPLDGPPPAGPMPAGSAPERSSGVSFTDTTTPMKLPADLARTVVPSTGPLPSSATTPLPASSPPHGLPPSSSPINHVYARRPAPAPSRRGWGQKIAIGVSTCLLLGAAGLLLMQRAGSETGFDLPRPAATAVAATSTGVTVAAAPPAPAATVVPSVAATRLPAATAPPPAATAPPPAAAQPPAATNPPVATPTPGPVRATAEALVPGVAGVIPAIPTGLPQIVNPDNTPSPASTATPTSAPAGSTSSEAGADATPTPTATETPTETPTEEPTEEPAPEPTPPPRADRGGRSRRCPPR